MRKLQNYTPDTLSKQRAEWRGILAQRKEAHAVIKKITELGGKDCIKKSRLNHKTYPDEKDKKWLAEHPGTAFPDFPQMGNNLTHTISSACDRIKNRREHIRPYDIHAQTRDLQYDLLSMKEAGNREIRNALREWRPKVFMATHAIHVNHSSEITLFRPKTETTDYRNSNGHPVVKYPMGLAKGRKKAGIPWVMTDRFVLSFESAEGKWNDHTTPLEEGVPYPCLFIDNTGPCTDVKHGYIATHGGFWGCATRSFDAVKASKMKAVQHVKKTIGVL